MVVSQYTLLDLPANSQVLFEVLELCQHPDTTSEKLAASVLLDPVLCSTLLSLGADQVDLRDAEHGILEQIVSRLGTGAVQSVTLDIARRLCQQPHSAEQQAFIARLWRRMVLAAKLGSAFAILTHYGNPAEAYLAGLLQGLGHLRIIVAAADEPGLLRMDSDEQAIVDAQRSLFTEDHCQWAYHLVKNWGMPGFLADAIRYQNQGIDQVADAHPLVRISSLVAQLASPRFDVVNQGIDMARQLYGIDPSLCEEILSQARAETQRTAAELGIQAHSDFSPQPMLALGRLVDDLLHIQSIFSSLNADKTVGMETRKIFARVLKQALGSKNFRILMHDPSERRLLGFSDGRDILSNDSADADWYISLDPARSAMAVAFDQGVPRFFDSEGENLTVADRQLLDMLQQPAALCLPVIVDASHGVLVVAGGSQEAMSVLAGRSRFLQLLCAILARLLNEQKAEPPGPPSIDDELTTSFNVREMVHEVSNPLSIISNYLGILAHKLDQHGEHYNELDIMGEELQRITGLLRGWSSPEQAREPTAIVDINQLVERLLHTYRATLLEPALLPLLEDSTTTAPMMAASPSNLRFMASFSTLRKASASAIRALRHS